MEWNEMKWNENIMKNLVSMITIPITWKNSWDIVGAQKIYFEWLQEEIFNS